MVYQTGGGTVDSPTGGVKINMIPKEGGNRFSGSLFQGYENWQSDNLTPFLAANGVKTVDKIGTYHDIERDRRRSDREGQAVVLRVGPPLHREQADRQHLRVRRHARRRRSPARTRSPDAAARSARRASTRSINSGLVRADVAGQPAQQAVGVLSTASTRSAAPRWPPGDDQTTSSVVWTSPLYMTNTVKWTSTVSSKLLVEGGFSSNIERYNNLYQPGIEQPYGSPAWLADARHCIDPASRRHRSVRVDQYGCRRRVRQLSRSLQHAGVGVVRHRLARVQGRVPGFVGAVQPDTSARTRTSTRTT